MNWGDTAVGREKERWFGVEAKLWFVLDSFYSNFLLKLYYIACGHRENKGAESNCVMIKRSLNWV
jgi:hypothetical protein